MDPTTDPNRRSYIETHPDSHFPIQNLPFGVFRPLSGGPARVASRIGDFVVDLATLDEAGFFKDCPCYRHGAFDTDCLNPLLALGREAWQAVRAALSSALCADEPALRDNPKLRESVLIPVDRVEMLLPVEIGDYTDFYSSKEHATNVGTMFRGADNALMPNWLHLPVGYHGRASSVVVSGTGVRRPNGQTMPDGADAPVFGPCRLMDFELETGFFVGKGNALGEPIPVNRAHEHIFGMVLVNDWSARDIQKWEYQPLGPFNAKNFATSISPWVVTLEALEPFRCDGPVQEPKPMDYLRGSPKSTYDITLDVLLKSPAMDEGTRICRSNFKYLYWSVSQQLAHHTITGCNARPGDMMASGTISGPTPDSYGSMLELTWRGTKPVQLPDGTERKFLQDGDELTMTGWCQGDGYRVGFGEDTGKVLPAI